MRAGLEYSHTLDIGTPFALDACGYIWRNKASAPGLAHAVVEAAPIHSKTPGQLGVDTVGELLPLKSAYTLRAGVLQASRRQAPSMGRRKDHNIYPPWSVVALAVEAASLAVWVAVSSSPGWKEVSLLLLGLCLSWLTLHASGSHPKRELWGWALQLHRCCLAHAFSPADRVSSSDALPASARVCWLLLVKTGVINVSRPSCHP